MKIAKIIITQVIENEKNEFYFISSTARFDDLTFLNGIGEIEIFHHQQIEIQLILSWKFSTFENAQHEIYYILIAGNLLINSHYLVIHHFTADRIIWFQLYSWTLRYISMSGTIKTLTSSLMTLKSLLFHDT